MLRGSVGFLLEEPKPEQGSLVPTLLKEAVEEATAALTDLASGEGGKFAGKINLDRLRDSRRRSGDRVAGQSTRWIGIGMAISDHRGGSRRFGPGMASGSRPSMSKLNAMP
jgi:hypothetical protein